MNDLTPTGYLVTGSAASFVNILINNHWYTRKSCEMAQRPLTNYWNGLKINLACDQSNQLVNFFVFGYIKNKLTNNSQRNLTNSENFGIGIISGTASAGLLTSGERVMIIQQANTLKSNGKYIDSTIDKNAYRVTNIYKTIIAVEGVQGLVRGIIPTAIRESTNSCCFFGLSQIFQPIFEKMLLDTERVNKTVVEQAAVITPAYFVSGVVAGRITTYIDIVKTQMQKEIVETEVSFVDTAKKVLEKFTMKEFLKCAVARSGTIGCSYVVMGLTVETFFPTLLPDSFRNKKTGKTS